MTIDISAGIAWLDEHAKPGWRTAVDIERLDIASPCRCVCGQLFDLGFLEGSTNTDQFPFARVMDYYGVRFSDMRRFVFGWHEDTPGATKAWRAFFASAQASS